MTRSWTIAGIFIVLAPLNVYLAWDGSTFPLVVLGATQVFLAVCLGIYATGWRRALDGWETSNTMLARHAEAMGARWPRS